MAQFEIVQSDDNPVLQATLYAGSGVPIDLTGATVKIFVEDADGVVIVNDATCTIIGAPTAGVVQFGFSSAQTVAPGLYYFEFHVTLAGGGKLTVPTAGPHQLIIRPRLAA